MSFIPEDKVRDGYTTDTEFVKGAKQILEFDIPTPFVEQGTGQIYTFNQLGFSGYNKKPDGWFLPKDLNSPAIILETKNSNEDLDDIRWVKEIKENCDICMQQPSICVTI